MEEKPEVIPEESSQDTLIDKHKFYFETPLYEPVLIEMIDEEELDDFFSGRVDAYSSRNNIDTTYALSSWKMDDHYGQGFDGFRKVKLTCTRKPEDKLFFFVFIGEDTITKVGQIPSLADLQFAEIGKKYNKSLDRDDMKEFKKAIGLAAHGVGAGSFVYLRRIFEKLIDEAYSENSSDIKIDKANYIKQRMDEKVETLKDFLPSQLVSMKRIYSILSSGVHTLSEEDCLKYFPALKLSIELILDERIEADIKKQRDELARKQIADIESSLQA